MRRLVFPLIFGLGGVAVLIALGNWQMRRMEWKAGVLAGIESVLTAPPVALSGLGEPGPALRYRAVTVAGRTLGPEILVLSGRKGVGPGYRVIAAFQTVEAGLILLDRGFLPEVLRHEQRAPAVLSVTGNLDWPEEADSYTPAPDLDAGLWFARDVPAMAAALGTRAVMVVLRNAEGEAQGIAAAPVDTSGVPNDHYGYALTWYALAAVWAGMTGLLVWRMRTAPAIRPRVP